MQGQPEAEALARGRAINIRNRITAIICGCAPAAVLAWQDPPTLGIWLAGLVAGLVWANGFEYAFHRWLLHLPDSYTGKGHLLHHASIGLAEEPLYVNLGGRPLWIVAMFVSNGIPVVAADYVLGWGVAPGMLVMFSLYFVLTEEIHWRFHLGGWLPRWLQPARARHFAHHERPEGDFNIFLPLFDRLVQSGPNPRLLE